MKEHLCRTNKTELLFIFLFPNSIELEKQGSNVIEGSILTLVLFWFKLSVEMVNMYFLIFFLPLLISSGALKMNMVYLAGGSLTLCFKKRVAAQVIFF